MHIKFSEIEGVSFEELYKKLNSSSDFVTIEVEMNNIGYASSHLDVAYDYLLASCIGELLNGLSREITYKEHRYNSGFPYLSIIFILKPIDIFQLSKKLHYISMGLEDPNHEFNNEIAEHEGDVHEGSKCLKFPKIIDNYFANHIEGYYDLDEDYVLSEIRNFPERRYGYWRSLYSNSIKKDVYFSIYGGWIIPMEVDLNKLVHDYLNIQQLNIFEAQLVVDENKQYLVNFDHIVELPKTEIISDAQKCAVRLNEDKNHFEYDSSYDASFKKYFISTTGDIIVANDIKYSYVFFYPKKLNFHNMRTLRGKLEESTEIIDDLAGIKSDIDCDWGRLNDDTFEQLCYDILYHHERFDSERIRKLGKSRSRDGGRDIEVWTIPLPGNKAKKFIIQCKLFKPDSSLSEAKIKGYSDTIMRYNPDGYGVMTTVIIDATLYDALDSTVSTYKKIGKDLEILTWSYLEIERFLARNPKIKNRYF